MTEIIQKARLTFMGVDDENKDNIDSIYTTMINSTTFPVATVDANQIIDGVTYITKAVNFTYRKNTKRYKFTMNKNNLKMLNLSTKAKLVIESISIPNIISQSFLQVKNINNIIVRMLGISNNNNFDSSSKGKGGTVIFTSPVKLNTQGFGTTYNAATSLQPDLLTANSKTRINSDNNGCLFINPCPEYLYSFNISEDFIANGIFEFELIYDIGNCWKNNATVDTYELIPQTLDITTDKNDLEAFQITFLIMDYDETQEKVFNSKELLNKINKLIIDKRV